MNNCWIWAGTINVYGYGICHYRVGGVKRMVYAHRMMYEQAKSKIPKGLQIDHLCRNRLCINPEHLEVVTRKVNLLRGNSFSAINARKTHCKNGHEYTPDNTYYIKRNGVFRQRECKLCRKQYGRL